MALDKEIKLIEEDNSEYAINPYTIQYDSKAKRFFKGFAPKAGWGGLVTATIFGAATIATGGIASATVGLIAGTSVALGALATTAYSGIVYRRNAAKSRFKALGVGGKAMLLMSGGIDSPVAAYLMMKRGVKIEAIHFASPPYTSMQAVDKVKDLLYVLSKYPYSHLFGASKPLCCQRFIGWQAGNLPC